MLLVIDANIVLSSLTAGRIVDLIFSPKLDLIAPELLFLEVEKHKEDIKNRSAFTDKEIEILLSLLKNRIRIIPLKEFISYFPKAENILKDHKKDSPYLALALKLNCPIWSYEKKFKDIKEIKSITTEELVKLIKTN